jgi:hypothetical protein
MVLPDPPALFNAPFSGRLSAELPRFNETAITRGDDPDHGYPSA